LIAPRHPERAAWIEKIVNKYGFQSMSLRGRDSGRSNPKNVIASPSARNDVSVFILDTVGQLIQYYAIADIVFVGGSLVKLGGHNILEPASFKKPVIFGPHMFNFRDIADLFLENKAGSMVADAQGLGLKIKEALSNGPLAGEQGARAYELIVKNSGATQKNIEIIKQILI
jgi:3-deoxy-D-manno-octulosonic-acid transferase